MKRFRSFVALTMAALIVSAAFSGCNSSPGTKESSSNTPVSEQATSGKSKELNAEIKVLTYDHSSDPKDLFARSLNSSVDNLHKSFPNIKITWINVPYAEYENKLRLALSSGTGADVIWIDTPNLASYASNGALVPLNDYWDKDDFSDLLDSSQQAMQYNGKIYAAPLNEANLCIFYNKDLTDKAGIKPPKSVADAWTWDQFYEAASKLTEKDSSGKIKVYGASPCMDSVSNVSEGGTYGLISWIWQGGGSIISEDGKKAAGVFDNQENVKTLQFFQKFFTNGISPKQAITNGFETGKIAMTFVGPWEFGTLKTKYPNFHVGTSPLPKNVKAASPTGSWDVGITTQCKNPDAAWKFVKQLESKADSKVRTDARGDLPARKSLVNESALLNTELYQPIKEQLLNGATARPVTPAYPKISEALNKTFNDVAFGKDPETTVKKYAQDMQKALDEIK